MKSTLLRGIFLLVSFTLVSCFDSTTDTVNTNQQLLEDIMAIDDYLLANPPAASDILVRDESGIRLVITEMGTGEIPPTLENIIQVEYVGRVLNNGVIISTPFDQDDSFTLTLTTADAGSDVIQGWKIALRMMTEGTKARVFIPSLLAYGTRGSGSIPPNTVLVFDLYLRIVDIDNQEPRLTRDIDSVTTYLAENEITNTQVHHSGMRYAITEVGTGATPGLYDQVVIKYTGKLMNEEGEIFDENVERGPVAGEFSSRTVNYVHGLTYGLQLMKAGGKATFYLPSVLGYGPASSAKIPAHSRLIYEIELLEVIPNEE